MADSGPRRRTPTLVDARAAGTLPAADPVPDPVPAPPAWAGPVLKGPES
ncbi:hypothetical protein ACFWIO_23210 [Streptomyces diastatochromogenes]